MKATTLLKTQHRVVAKLFKRLRKTGDDEKSAVFLDLATLIVGHHAMEREILYPACEKQMGATSLLGEATVEHGLVEFCLFEAYRGIGDATFDAKVAILEEIVGHHMAKQEKRLFPKAEKALGARALKELGVAMEARLGTAKANGYNGPLLDNLRRVLETAIDQASGVPSSVDERAAVKPAAH